MLTLPLWIVTAHILPTNPEHTADQTPGRALGFSTGNKLMAFMSRNLGGEWKMQMASDRDGLIILIAELHRLNIREVTLDPDDDVEEFVLSDLVALADSLSP